MDNNNTSAAARDNVKVEFVEDLWVQCDAPSCRKWRRLPPGTAVDDHGRWYCRMNPDTRYNACDADEEVYDERNEILLTAAPPETSSKTRHKSKRRKKDEAAERTAALKAELLRRNEWCAAQLKRIEEQPETALEWTPADFRLLRAHVPSMTETLVEMSELFSSSSYCSEGQRMAALLETTVSAQRIIQQAVLLKASDDIEVQVQEVADLG